MKRYEIHIRHAIDMDHALTGVRELHVKAPAGDTGDDSVELLPDETAHILALLQLVRLPLRLVGPPLQG